MDRLPGSARIASIVAFVFAGLVILSGIFGSIVVLPEALIGIAAAIGIRRGRSWSAYGLALFLLAQVAMLPFILMRGRVTDTVRGEAVLAAFLQATAGILLFAAGRSLSKAGGSEGSPLSWVIVTAAFTVPLFFVEAFVIPTSSMENTLLPGDRIFVQTFPRSTPHAGDVFALVYPVDRKQTFVKRIIGMPGDHIRISHKILYRNGVQLNEPYIVHKTDYEDSYRDDFPSDPNVPVYPQAAAMLKSDVSNGELVVPPGRYFVLGDNRDQSLDSRYWGFVSAADLIGKPLFIYDSSDSSTQQLTDETTFHRTHTRWNRLFKVL